MWWASGRSSIPNLAKKQPYREQGQDFSAKPTCTLLDLPAELRNAIYLETLLVKTGRDARAATYQDLLDRPEAGCPELGFLKAPPILHTCRQIRLEALPIFLGENTMAITYCNGQIRKPNPRTLTWLEPVCSELQDVVLRVDAFGHKPSVVGTLRLEGGTAELRNVDDAYVVSAQHARECVDGLRGTHVCEVCGDRQAEVDIHQVFTIARIFFGGSLNGADSLRDKTCRCHLHELRGNRLGRQGGEEWRRRQRS